MTDTEFRSLERRAKAGDLAAEEAWLAHRVRTGELSVHRARAAAHLGHPAFHPLEPAPSEWPLPQPFRDEPDEYRRALCTVFPALTRTEKVAWACEVFERAMFSCAWSRNEPRYGEVLRLVRAALVDPSKREAAFDAQNESKRALAEAPSGAPTNVGRAARSLADCLDDELLADWSGAFVAYECCAAAADSLEERRWQTNRLVDYLLQQVETIEGLSTDEVRARYAQVRSGCLLAVELVPRFASGELSESRIRAAALLGHPGAAELADAYGVRTKSVERLRPDELLLRGVSLLAPREAVLCAAEFLERLRGVVPRLDEHVTRVVELARGGGDGLRAVDLDGARARAHRELENLPHAIATAAAHLLDAAAALRADPADATRAATLAAVSVADAVHWGAFPDPEAERTSLRRALGDWLVGLRA